MVCEGAGEDVSFDVRQWPTVSKLSIGSPQCLEVASPRLDQSQHQATYFLRTRPCLDFLHP